MGTSFVDDGIVLRRVDYAEHDRILTVLTREHGKLGVIARAARRARSRLAAHTDLFSQSRMQLVSGRGELLVLTQAERLEAPPGGDARRAACAAVVAELCDRVLESHHPDPEIFDLVSGAIARSSDPARDPRVSLVWFARRMIDRLGYAPQVDVCAGCGGALDADGSAFSPAGGGLLCARCAAADPGALDCPARVIKVLRVAAQGDAATWDRLRLDPATVLRLEMIVEREMEHHLDRRLRSLEVLRALG